MFNPDQADLGSYINFIFTGLSFISIFIFYFYPPETAHRSFEEVGELFAAKVPARHWVGYNTDKQIRAETAFADVKIEESCVEDAGLLENVTTDSSKLSQ